MVHFTGLMIYFNQANGPFYWADGSAFQYTLWAPEEPNYSPTGTTQCGDMLLKSWPGHWNDHPCNTYTKKFYVCKTPQGKIYFSYVLGIKITLFWVL